MAISYGYPPENMTGIIDFLQYTNSMTDGLLGVGSLIIIFFVSLLSTKSFSYEKALGFASFLTMISAILLRFMNLISDYIMSLSIIGVVFSIILLMKERSTEGV